MGKGDIRTKKGKIYRGTYGKTRKRSTGKNTTIVKKSPAKAPAAKAKK